MELSGTSPRPAFTRLHARITQEDGAFTVSIRMLNHQNDVDRAWGNEIAPSIEIASRMIGALAEQFSIPQGCISINIVMTNFKDGTLH